MAGGSASGQAGWQLTGPSPGEVVAGYRLEERIGAGGMAVVFRASDERLGRTVALKLLAPALAGDGGFRERFIRESRAAAAVDHPHIIPVYGAGEAGGILYLAMRYVSGGDLRSVMYREGPLPAERAAFLLSPVASALDAAHAAGLVHRDVKPANILVDMSPGRPDHPYLSDFGLAKGAASVSGLTGTGQFLGTADYAAPEQISGGRPQAQADQYALACVAFTMLTGVLPFSRDAPMAVLWAHLNDPPPSVTAARMHVLRPPDGSDATCSVFSFGSGVFDTGNRLLVTGDRDGRAYLWNAATGTLFRSVRDPGGSVATVAISFGGSLLATAGTGNAVYLWDATTGASLGTIRDPGGDGVKSLAFGTNLDTMNASLAVADKNGTTYVWPLAD